MADAAAKVGDGKSSWQRFVGGVVDMVRPVAAGMAPAVMPLLDRPAMRRVEQAVNIEDLRVAAEKRAHAMVYGYLAGGADEERALRRSVAAYNDVELRHAVLHGIGHADMDLRTKILGVDTELPFLVTSCAGLGLGLGLGLGSGLGLGLGLGLAERLEVGGARLEVGRGHVGEVGHVVVAGGGHALKVLQQPDPDEERLERHWRVRTSRRRRCRCGCLCLCRSRRR